MNKKKIIFHGEVAFFQVDNIPKTAKKISVDKDYFIVGESETHGNDHRVSTIDTEIFTDEDVMFLKSIGKTQVYCPNQTRHDTLTLPACDWMVGHASEWDYFTERQNRVRD